MCKSTKVILRFIILNADVHSRKRQTQWSKFLLKEAWERKGSTKVSIRNTVFLKKLKSMKYKINNIKVYKGKSWLFEDINNIDKHLWDWGRGEKENWSYQ